MATFYSSLYEQLPQSPLRYASKAVMTRIADNVFMNYWQLTLPVGATAADVIKISPVYANIAVATPQIAGIRFPRIVLRSAGNVGGATTANFGFANASATAFGAALTTLQSAGTLDVPIATLMAAPVILQNDEIQLVLAGGPTTTAFLIDGWIQVMDNAP